MPMHIADRDKTVQREAARAARNLADFLVVVVEQLRAGLGRLIGVDQQSAQALRRLAPPMDSRDDLLTQVAPLRVTNGRLHFGFHDDVIVAGVDALARDARLDARDFERFGPGPAGAEYDAAL